MEPLSPAARQGDAVVRLTTVLIGVVVWLPFQLLYVGPAVWLAEFQTRLLGSYYPIVSYCVVGIPLGHVLYLVVTRKQAWRETVVVLATKGAGVRPYIAPLGLLGMTILMSSTGVRQWLAPQRGTMTVTEAARQVDGEFYATISGRVVDAPFWFSRRGKNSEYYYVPLRSVGDERNEVVLLIGGSEGELRRLDVMNPSGETVSVTGLVDDKMPAEDMTWFRKTTGLPLSERARVIRPKIQADDPTPIRFALGVLVVGVVTSTLMLVRIRRRPATLLPPKGQSR